MRDRKATVRFARAFFAEAQQREAVEQAGRDLALLAQYARAVPELVRLLANPIVSAEEKKGFCRRHFGGIVQTDQLHFLDLLIDHERAALLADVAEAFQALLDDHRRTIRAEVWAAVPLTEAEQERLRGALAAAFAGEPVLTVSVRPELIGGVRVRVKDTVIDGSFRTALRTLGERLKGVCFVPPTTGDQPVD